MYQRFFTLFATCVALCGTSVAQSQWQWNSTSGTWSTDFNWLPATIPAGSNDATLVFSGNNSYTATNDIGTFSLNKIIFTNTSGTATVRGVPGTHAINLVASGRGSLPTLQLTSSGNATVSAPLNWNANTNVINSGSGTLILSGTQAYSAGTKHTFTNGGTGTITLSDDITYSGSGLVLNFINNNAATGSFNVGDLGTLGNVTFNIGGSGVVRFNGTGGDLFGGSAILNVLAGATFDFNGNAETMGAISGAGTIQANVGITNTMAGYYVFSGSLMGTAATSLSVSGTGTTVVLSGSNSTYAGVTSITNGRLIISANAPSGSAGALGSATSDVLVGPTSGSARTSLLIDTAGANIGRNIRIQSGGTGISTVGGLNNLGTVTYSGNLILGTNNGITKGVTLSAAAGGTVEFTGRLQRASGATGTTDAVTVTGEGTIVFRGTNNYSGSTTISAGTLWLDYFSNNGGKIGDSAPLIMNGGSLKVTGNSDASTEQNIGELILGNSASPSGGGGGFSVIAGQDQDVTIFLGGITRYTGATVNFHLEGTGVGLANIYTSGTNTSDGGILGSYATFNKSGWAAVDFGGTLITYAESNYSDGFGTGLHTSLAASTAMASGGATTHSLRFAAAAALTFNATPGVLMIESGGILVASSTNGATSIGTTGTRGTLSTTSGELIIHQHATSGSLSIHSVITGTNLTKSGSGTLVLTGTNTYTGTTFINGGTVMVTAAANLGAVTADVFINGGTLTVASGTLGTLNAANRVITVGSGGATFNFTANISSEGSGIAGTGTITKTGTGTWGVGSSASTFSGDIVINAGVLQMASPQFKSVASITVNSGGTYNINDDGTDTFSLATGGRLLLNGIGAGGNGALRLTDQSSSVVALDPRTTIDREIVLQSDSRIQVDNGTAAGSLSHLILTGNLTGAGALIKTGAGVLILTSRDNVYTGGTKIEAGTLRLNTGNDRLPTDTIVTLGAGANSGVLQLNGYSQKIAGLNTNGSGTANAVIGGTADSNSLLTLNVASGTETYNGTLGGSGTANTHSNNNLSFNKDGDGTVILSGDNTYNGGTTIAKGTLALGHSNALGGGGATLATGNGNTTVETGATLDLNGQTDVHESVILNGHGVSGAGALVNNSTTHASLGSGIASISTSSFNTAGWTAGATIAITPPSTGSAATASVELSLSQASLSLTSGGSGFGITPVVTVSGGNGAVITARVGVTSSSYTITPGTTTYSVAPTVTLQNGAKAVAILGGDGRVVGITVTDPGLGFSSTPTIAFTGGTVLVAGTLPTGTGNNTNYTIVALTLVNPGSGFTSVPTITITGGTGATAAVSDGLFNLDGFTITDNGSGYTTPPEITLTGGEAAAVANLATVRLNSDSSIGGSGDLTINSVVTGGASLTKVGAGTTTLTGANHYTGDTVVAQGTLALGHTDALGNGGTTMSQGSGSTTVQSGATLDLNGQSNVNEVIILNGSGVDGAGALVNNSTVQASLGSGVVSLSLSSPTTTGWAAGSTVSIDPPSSGTGATAQVSLGLSQSSITLTNGGSGFGLNPEVSVSGGTGAVVTAELGVTAASFTLSPGTTTYSAAPTVTLQNGATGLAVLAPDGTVASVTITDPGRGFTSTPVLTFSGGTVLVAGTNPTATGNNNNYTVTGLSIVDPGRDFSSAPVLTITGGTGATATGNDASFILAGMAVTNNGSGYSAEPSVTVNGRSVSVVANIASVGLASNSSVGGSGDLTIHSVISGDYALTKVGTGTTTLTANNVYTGATIVDGGTLQIGKAGQGTSGLGDISVNAGQLVGTGTVLGNSFTLASGATLQAGDIVSGGDTGNGTLKFSPSDTGSFVLAGGSKVVLTLTGATITDATFDGNARGTSGYNSFVNNVSGAGDHDLLIFEGYSGTTLNFAADITIIGNNFTAAAGQVFNLLDWSSLIATDFSGFNVGVNLRDGSADNDSQFDLPDISGTGYAWDVSQFLNSGNLAVVAMIVPEPGRATLLLLGMAGLLLRRRKPKLEGRAMASRNPD